MRRPGSEEVNLVQTMRQCLGGGADLRDHSPGDDTAIDELLGLGSGEAVDQGLGIRRILHETRHIAQEDQLGSRQGGGESGGGDIGVDVHGFPGEERAERRDHRNRS